MIHTAAILAAGAGTRLGDDFADRPKGFLQLGTQPIIAESLQRLARAGIREVVIVTGHQAGYYEQLRHEANIAVRTVHNASYAESGSMYSLYCARHELNDTFLLLESDLIYEPRALSALLEHPADDAILLSGPTEAGDEVWVATRNGSLTAMSKDPASLADAGEISGELVGICKISPPLFEIMLRVAESAFTETLHFDYETDCLVAAAAQRNIACPLIPDLAWAEIDDAEHLRRARETVYPEIERRGSEGV